MTIYDRTDLSDLTEYLKVQGLGGKMLEIIDMIDGSFTLSAIQRDLKAYFTELYVVLFICPLEDLPMEVNGPYKEVVSWRLSRGK